MLSEVQITTLGIILPPFLIAILSSLWKRPSWQLGRLTLLASLVSFVFSLILPFILPPTTASFPPFSLFIFQFHIDALSTYFILLVNVVALFASYSTIFLIEPDIEAQEATGKGPNPVQRFHMLFNF